jgi:hypothetical protein
MRLYNSEDLSDSPLFPLRKGRSTSIGWFTKLGRFIGCSAAFDEHSADWATEPVFYVLGWLDPNLGLWASMHVH